MLCLQSCNEYLWIILMRNICKLYRQNTFLMMLDSIIKLLIWIFNFCSESVSEFFKVLFCLNKIYLAQTFYSTKRQGKQLNFLFLPIFLPRIIPIWISPGIRIFPGFLPGFLPGFFPGFLLRAMFFLMRPVWHSMARTGFIAFDILETKSKKVQIRIML